MTHESLLIVAGSKGIIRVIGTSTVNCRAVSHYSDSGDGDGDGDGDGMFLIVLLGSWELYQRIEDTSFEPSHPPLCQQG